MCGVVYCISCGIEKVVWKHAVVQMWSQCIQYWCIFARLWKIKWIVMPRRLVYWMHVMVDERIIIINDVASIRVLAQTAALRSLQINSNYSCTTSGRILLTIFAGWRAGDGCNSTYMHYVYNSIQSLCKLINYK